MVRVEVSQGVFVTCELKEVNGKLVLECNLRRQGRLGLRIYEKLSSVEEISDLLNRPRWLGEESDRAIKRALTLLLERLRGDEEIKGRG